MLPPIEAEAADLYVVDTMRPGVVITPLLVALREFSSTLKTSLIVWLGDAANGIGKLFAREIHTTMLCMAQSGGTEVCVTGDELDAIVTR